MGGEINVGGHFLRRVVVKQVVEALAGVDEYNLYPAMRGEAGVCQGGWHDQRTRRSGSAKEQRATIDHRCSALSSSESDQFATDGPLHTHVLHWRKSRNNPANSRKVPHPGGLPVSSQPLKGSF